MAETPATRCSTKNMPMSSTMCATGADELDHVRNWRSAVTLLRKASDFCGASATRVLIVLRLCIDPEQSADASLHRRPLPDWLHGLAGRLDNAPCQTYLLGKGLGDGRRATPTPEGEPMGDCATAGAPACLPNGVTQKRPQTA